MDVSVCVLQNYFIYLYLEMTQTVDDGKTTPNLTIECENEYFGVNCSSSPCKTKGYERKCHQKCEFTMYRFKW